MATLNILRYPDPMLKRVCDPITNIDHDLRMFIADMGETMVAADGVGLAAPQVGRPLRLFLVDIWWKTAQQYDKTLVFINPKITAFAGIQRLQEGCLSLPGVVEHVSRAERIRVTAQNINGEPFELDAEEYLAVAIQHELDHLNGVLTLDRLSPLARKLAIKKLA